MTKIIHKYILNYTDRRFGIKAKTPLHGNIMCAGFQNNVLFVWIEFNDTDILTDKIYWLVGTGRNHVGTINDLKIWNGISSPNASGRKIVFTDNAFDTSAVEYSSETVMYNPISGDYFGYVRIPSLTTGADTTIQMYYNYTPSANPSYTPEVMPDDISDDYTSYANDTAFDAVYPTSSATPVGTRTSDSASVFAIANASADTTRTFDGFIDNVKISDKIRPSSHAITSYNAEKSDSDFVTTGTEVTQ